MSEAFVLRETSSEVSVEWRIERFLFRPEEPDYWLDSPSFPLSDAQFYLQIWPNGQTEKDSSGYLSLFLYKRFSTSNKHPVKGTLGIQRTDGSVFKSIDFEYEFVKCIGYGFRRFVLALELRQSDNIISADGTLKVLATVRLTGPTVLDKDKLVDMPQNVTFRVRPEEVSLEWKVEIFTSLLKAEGFRLKSPTFSLAGAEWCLQLYPNGLDSHSLGWVCLYLKKECSSSEKQTVVYTLGIRKKDGTPFRLCHHEMEFVYDTAWGCKKFLKSSELLDLENELVNQGSITLFCTARATPFPSSTATVTEPCIQASSDLSHEESSSPTTPYEQEAANASVRNLLEQLKRLLADGHHSDVTFKVHDHSFPAHRWILTIRSPVFFGMFENDTEEKRSGVVTITDFQPDTVRDLLSFLYTGDVFVVTSSNALELYKAADKYDIQDLKDAALRCMTRELSSEVFFDIFVLASLYNERELLNTASVFFVENAGSILAAPGWLPFLQDHTVTANELLQKLRSKKL